MLRFFYQGYEFEYEEDKNNNSDIIIFNENKNITVDFKACFLNEYKYMTE
jgi:hypothetical protein